MAEIKHDMVKEENQLKPEEGLEPPAAVEPSENQANPNSPQNIHNKLVVIQAINYKKHGYTDIKINHENYAFGQPAQIGGYTPDLSAVLDSKVTICEVETSDSVYDTQTVQKWREFDKSDYMFHLMIPSEALDHVKETAKSNGITIDKYWCNKS